MTAPSKESVEAAKDIVRKFYNTSDKYWPGIIAAGIEQARLEERACAEALRIAAKESFEEMQYLYAGLLRWGHWPDCLGEYIKNSRDRLYDAVRQRSSKPAQCQSCGGTGVAA